jgi:hypothetical protein
MSLQTSVTSKETKVANDSQNNARDVIRENEQTDKEDARC